MNDNPTSLTLRERPLVFWIIGTIIVTSEVAFRNVQAVRALG